MHALSIQGLQRKIVWLAVAIVLATGTGVAVSVLMPMQSEMRTAADLHIRHSLEVKRLAVEQYLSRLSDIGRQIVSRTQIRKRLIDFNDGKRTLEDVRSFSDPRLGDALKEAVGALGMVRLDKRHYPVSIVGQVPPKEIWADSADKDVPAFFRGPMRVDGRLVMFAITAIFDTDGRRHGTDIVMFQLDDLGAIITDTVMGGPVRYNSVLLQNSTDMAQAFGVFPGSSEMQFIDPPHPWASPHEVRSSDNRVTVIQGRDGTERAIASSVLNATGWVLVEMEVTKTLYAEGRRTFNQAVGVIIFMIAIGGVAVLSLMRTLTGRVLITTEDLQREVSERKRAQKQMRQAKDEAEKANQAKSKFLASMSHELRTPLNAVLGFGQLLQIDPKASLSPMQQEHVQSILEGGRHLLELVNQLLDLAKVESNQASLSLEEVDARDVVADCVNLTTPLGEVRGIKIIDALSDGGPAYLHTDQLRLKQIMLNLLSNAVKYNKDGGTVTINGWETENQFFRIVVTDTGRGIRKRDQAKVFSMFHRLGDDPNIAREGTGIGLAVTKLLVEQMAGVIGFESEVGVGSTFWIELPLVTNDDAVIWVDEMDVGVDSLDKDHQWIVKLLNKILHQPLDDVGLDDAIAELIEYAQYHFKREEVVMEVCGYPDIEEHKVMHVEFSEHVGALDKEWRMFRNAEILKKLQHLLRKLWLVHIQQEDAKISPYTQGREVDIQDALDRLERLSEDAPKAH